MKKFLENKKGITLIALIITIIILLILAGISIATLKHVGLFDKANQAKQKSENAQKEENVILGDYENGINNFLVGSTRDENTNFSYSSTEKQVGNWIDGSKIYQITRFYDNGGNGYGAGDYVLENIKQTLNADILVNYNATMSHSRYSFDFSKFSQPVMANDFFYYEDNNLHFYKSSSSVKWKLYLTIQYTKSNT